ncbi:MAG: hypothetical protein Kow0059_20810 [Candidatus Sumerlaeia bacterium]
MNRQSTATPAPPRDFFEIQRQQWRSSLLLFAVLLIFYTLAMSAIIWLGVLAFALVAGDDTALTADAWKWLLLSLQLAVVLAALHYWDAHNNGAHYILERLNAALPDPADRFHRQAVNLVEEMRVAGGLPRVQLYIIPSIAINSMAVIEADGTPAVILTEGLLADLTREELQAVVAHELAHIRCGDTFYLTLVCSLANIFERLREWMEIDVDDNPGPMLNNRNQTSSWAGFGYLAVLLAGAVMRLLSALISRRREWLADATAVQMTRNPQALARAIYKAHLKYSFVGDFNLTYSPLFIVDPLSEGDGEDDSWLKAIFGTHPPLKARLDVLATMAHTTAADIADEVWRSRQRHRDAREPERDEAGGASEPEGAGPSRTAQPRSAVPDPIPRWLACDAEGRWLGPFTLSELLHLPWFTPLIRVRRLGAPDEAEGAVAPAREFPEVRKALGFLLGRPGQTTRDGVQGGHRLCPRCRTPLRDVDYEGAPVRRCPQCGGHAVSAGVVMRILARRERGFTHAQRRRAVEFRRRVIINPGVPAAQRPADRLTCPECGAIMLARPYSYQYFVPVDKCLVCQTIWFDADELELLQILIEDSQEETTS